MAATKNTTTSPRIQKAIDLARDGWINVYENGVIRVRGTHTSMQIDADEWNAVRRAVRMHVSSYHLAPSNFTTYVAGR
jgi:hypothetical protein